MMDMIGPHSRKRALHSSFLHQYRVNRHLRIRKEDMQKLERFQHRVENLSARHSDIWRTYDLSYAKRYDDPEIRKRDREAAIKVDNLYYDWKDLRMEMEQFLEYKGLPTTYPHYSWIRYFIGDESGTFSYDGSAIITGFDYGPAMWCSNTLQGMTREMYDRCHLQWIEMYSVLGFIVGIVGALIGLIALFRSTHLQPVSISRCFLLENKFTDDVILLRVTIGHWIYLSPTALGLNLSDGMIERPTGNTIDDERLSPAW